MNLRVFALILLCLRTVQSINCEVGEYSEGMECKKCPSQCKSCLNGECLECSSQYKVPSEDSQLSCKFCDLGSFAFEGRECRQCPSIVNCETCADENRCLLCKEGFWLDLQSLQCLRSCAQDTIEKQFSNFKICRHPSEYFVDGNSTKPFEFGTKEFPFKRPAYAALELFNFRSKNLNEVIFYFPRGSHSIIHSEIQPLIFLGQKLVSFKPYPPPLPSEGQLPQDQMPLIETYASLDGIFENPTIFNPWLDSDVATYKFDEKVKNGQITVPETIIKNLKFSFFRATVTIDNFRIIERQPNQDDYNWFFLFFYSPLNSFQISHSYVEQYKTIIFSLYGANVSILNCNLLAKEMFYAYIQFGSANRCEGFKSHNLLVRNTTFEKHPYDDNSGAIFILEGPGNYTITESRFNNFQQKLSSGYIEGMAADNCYYEGEHSYTVTKNIWTGNLTEPALGSFFLRNTEKLGSKGTWSLEFSENVFRRVRFETQLFYFDSQKPWRKFQVSHNFFEQVEFPVDAPLFSSNSPSSKLTFNNNTFVNSRIDQVAAFTVQELNVEVLNVEKMQGLGRIVTGMFALVKVKKAELNSFNLSNSHLNQPFLYFQEVEDTQVHGIRVSASTFQKDLIVVNDAKSILFSDLQILNSQSSKTGLSLFNYNTINARSADSIFFKASQINMDKANFSFFQAEQVFVSEQSRKVEVVLEDFQIKNIENSYLQPIIHLKDLDYKDLQIIFRRGDVRDIKMRAPFFLGNCNCQVVFEELKLEMLEQVLFYLAPFQYNTSNPLRLLMKNSILENNFSGQDGGIVGRTNSVAEISNSRFNRNYSLGRGGLVLADSSGSEILFKTCRFEENYALQGGVAYAQTYSLVSFEKCEFYQNRAFTGGVAYIGSHGRSAFLDSSFISNQAVEAPIIFLTNSYQSNHWRTLHLDRNFVSDDFEGTTVTFQQTIKDLLKISQTQSSSHPIKVEKSQARISGIFSTKNQNDLFLVSASSNLKVENLTFKSAHINSIIEIVTSSFIVDGLYLEQIYQDLNNLKYLIEVSALSIIKIQSMSVKGVKENFFQGLNSEIIINKFDILDFDSKISKKGYLFFQSSDLRITDFKVSNYNAESRYILHVAEGNVEMTRIQVSNIKSPFLQADQLNIIIKEAIFTSFNLMQSQIQSSILLYQSNLIIENSTFEGFESSKAIQAEQSANSFRKYKIEVYDCKFIQLKSDQGAALDIQNYDLVVKNSSFERNTAQRTGGALHLSCDRSFRLSCNYNIQGNSFRQNKAEKGGSIYFDLMPFQQAQNTFEDNFATLGYGNDIASFPVKIRLISQPETIFSSQKLNEAFEFEILDLHDQVVSTDESSKVTVFSENEATSVSGIYMQQAKKGKVSFSQFQVKAQPNSVVTLKFAQDFISQDQFFQVTQRVYQDFEYKFEMPSCLKGQILKDGECVTCSKGTYQLEAGSTKCLFCPDNFHCPGGDTLLVDAGYWRANLESTQLYQCLQSDACLGSSDSSCKEGYQGKLCGICQGEVKSSGKYFARAGKYGCAECQENSKIVGQLLGVLLLVIVYVGVLVGMIIFSAQRNQQKQVLVRIMTNYFQIVLLVRNLDIAWPPRVEKLLSSISIVSSAQENLLQLSCLFRGSSTSPFLVSCVSLATVPFILGLVSTLLWRTSALISRLQLQTTWKRNSVATFFVLSYLTYPSITNSVFQGMNCIKIENESYLKSDLSLKCYEGQHQKIVFFVLLPIFVLWIVGFPAFTFILLKRNKSKLDEKEYLILLGLFYVGLKEDTFYWEVVVNNARKIFISIVSVTFASGDGHLQLMLIFTYLYTNHQMIKYFEPYYDNSINKIDLQSSSAAICAILLGLFFLKNNEERGAIELELIFWVLVLFNLIFIWNWGRMMANIYFQKIKTRILKEETGVRRAKMAEGFSYQRNAFQLRSEKLKAQHQQRNDKNKDYLKSILHSKQKHVPKQLPTPTIHQVFLQVQAQPVLPRSKLHARSQRTIV